MKEINLLNRVQAAFHLCKNINLAAIQETHLKSEFAFNHNYRIPLKIILQTSHTGEKT